MKYVLIFYTTFSFLFSLHFTPCANASVFIHLYYLFPFVWPFWFCFVFDSCCSLLYPFYIIFIWMNGWINININHHQNTSHIRLPYEHFNRMNSKSLTPYVNHLKTGINIIAHSTHTHTTESWTYFVNKNKSPDYNIDIVCSTTCSSFLHFHIFSSFSFVCRNRFSFSLLLNRKFIMYVYFRCHSVRSVLSPVIDHIAHGFYLLLTTFTPNPPRNDGMSPVHTTMQHMIKKQR